MIKRVMSVMGDKGSDAPQKITSIEVTPKAQLTSEGINASVEIRNVSKQSVELAFSSGLKYDFVLLDAQDKELYRWSRGKFFTMALESISIRPGERITYSEKLSKDEIGLEAFEKAVTLRTVIPAKLDSKENIREKIFQTKIIR